MDQNIQIGAKVSGLVYKIPRCPVCEQPNPEGRVHCPSCDEPAPFPTDIQTMHAVMTEEGLKVLEAVDG